MLLAVGAGESHGEFFIPAALGTAIVQQISAPKARDKQVLIGPSSIGDPCAYCVGQLMAASLPHHRRKPERWALAPWLGTAVHYWLEHHVELGEGWHSELDVPVAEIDGYGMITGHIDGYSEVAETVVDYKIVGDNTLKKLRQYGLGPQYHYQRNLYGMGVAYAGLPVKYVMNLYIPRNGTGARDIVAEVDHYDAAAAQEALDRAEVIWNDWVLTGKFEELASDEDCYDCNRLTTPQITELRRAR
jgi:hypothetical protein